METDRIVTYLLAVAVLVTCWRTGEPLWLALIALAILLGHYRPPS